MSDMLFEGYEPMAPPASADRKLSADRRRTLRQAEAIRAGRHPLTGGLLHEFGDRYARSSDGQGLAFRCGSCWFRKVFHPGNRAVAKCTFGMTNEHEYVTDAPRITGGPATDVRAWWPACPDYSPSDTTSPDAARSIPTPTPAAAGRKDTP